MKKKQLLFFLIPVSLFFIMNCGKKTGIQDYPILPVPFTEVTLKDHFWLPRINTNTKVTIPIAFRHCEQTGRIRNFEVAGGLTEGSFCSLYPFDDSDVFKIIEGASYSLHVKPDTALEAYLDSLIFKIAAAQEEDGYLYTNRTIDPENPHPWAGKNRWEHVDELSHELYNVGHLYEAAVAHYQATGKRTLLDVAIKNANLVYHDFGWGKIEKVPGHQEIEIGLVKLYRVTGDLRYLEMARFFLDARGPDGDIYNQAHKKVTKQKEAVGHAVRACYMYSAMADIAALAGDRKYLHAIDRIWKNVVDKKYYITGCIGQTGNNEGFGPAYDLPNMTAYCETCASVANIFWNYRLFLLHGEAKYMDVLERTLYNARLSGVSLSGDHFFYPNPLESEGQHERKEWFGCACCPSNIARFLPSLPGYIYAHTSDEIFVNLYISSETSIHLEDNQVNIRQISDYPLNGDIVLNIDPDKEGRFDLLLRIPGWARNKVVPSKLYHFLNKSEEMPQLAVNREGKQIAVRDGYARIRRYWKKGDKVELKLPMPVRKIMAHDSVAEDKGKFAIQRGPLVFCVEDKDNDQKEILHIYTPLATTISEGYNEDLFNGSEMLGFMGFDVYRQLDGSVTISEDPIELCAIPYHLWANRGPGQMLVWIPDEFTAVRPFPAPTIASKSKISAFGNSRTLFSLSDQYRPENSNDHTRPYVHWWPAKDTMVWVEYDFDRRHRVSKVLVYWFDDRPDGGCRIPESWSCYYSSPNGWTPVRNIISYQVTKDDYDSVLFEPVTTSALRLEIKLPEEYSSGIHEWVVY